jgi:murein L,D-transpeptidase YcbB/YkuD
MPVRRAVLTRWSLAWALCLSTAPALSGELPDIVLPELPEIGGPPAFDGASRPDGDGLRESAAGVRRQDDFSLSLPPLPDAAVILTFEDRLRGAIGNRLAAGAESIARLGPAEREGLAQAYAARKHRPLWIADGTVNAAGQRVLATLRAAEEDGLDPADYGVVLPGRRAAVEDWADAELRISSAALRYARDARGARIEPSKLSSLVTPKLSLPDAGEVLQALAAARDAGAALSAYNPPHPGYRALKERLAELRSMRPGPAMVRVPPGPTLRVGMRDSRVPLIRARLNLKKADGDERAYDERVASAVAAFQRDRGLPATGTLTPKTVAALGGAASSARLEEDLIANMERWRWLPPDLGLRHIAVNVPEFRLRLFENGSVVHHAKVIVGKTESQTPIFSDPMEYLVVNPSWTVPPSIVRKEILPGLAEDPYYAERRGYRVIRRGNRIIVQQPPGERNALGFIKFMFPNQHAVYLHDTPSRRLFSADRRAFSHGCVRVDQPFHLAELILQSESGWTEAKLRKLIGRGERHIRLKNPLPVHLTYFTVSIEPGGQMRTFDDLYGLNRKVKAALGYPG